MDADPAGMMTHGELVTTYGGSEYGSHYDAARNSLISSGVAPADVDNVLAKGVIDNEFANKVNDAANGQFRIVKIGHGYGAYDDPTGNFGANANYTLHVEGDPDAAIHVANSLGALTDQAEMLTVRRPGPNEAPRAGEVPSVNVTFHFPKELDRDSYEALAKALKEHPDLKDESKEPLFSGSTLYPTDDGGSAFYANSYYATKYNGVSPESYLGSFAKNRGTIEQIFNERGHRLDYDTSRVYARAYDRPHNHPTDSLNKELEQDNGQVAGDDRPGEFYREGGRASDEEERSLQGDVRRSAAGHIDNRLTEATLAPRQFAERAGYKFGDDEQGSGGVGSPTKPPPNSPPPTIRSSKEASAKAGASDIWGRPWGYGSDGEGQGAAYGLNRGASTGQTRLALPSLQELIGWRKNGRSRFDKGDGPYDASGEQDAAGETAPFEANAAPGTGRSIRDFVEHLTDGETTDKEKSIVDHVLAAIDVNHSVDGLESVDGLGRVPIRTQLAKYIDGGQRGKYTPFENELKIQIAHDKPWPRISGLHEFGHMFDHLKWKPQYRPKTIDDLSPDEIGRNESIAGKTVDVSSSVEGPEFANWRHAVEQTEAVKALRKAQKTGYFEVTAPDGEVRQVPVKDQEDLSYLLEPEELFARSYAQWIAANEAAKGHPEFSAELAKMLSDHSTVAGHEQWNPKDFNAVAKALGELFQLKGGRK